MEVALSDAIRVNNNRILIANRQKLEPFPDQIVKVIDTLASKDVRTINRITYNTIASYLNGYYAEHLRDTYDSVGSSIVVAISVIMLFLSIVVLSTPLIYLFVAMSNNLVSYRVAAAIFSFISVDALVLFGLSAVFSKHIFGRYKSEDLYRERLMWDSFGRLLRNESLLKKYGPEDSGMWGKWLAYAYAFGVPKKIIDNVITERMDNRFIVYSNLALIASHRMSVIGSRGAGGGSVHSGGYSGFSFGGGFVGGGSFGAR